MDIKKLAKDYSQGKALESIEAAIEAAYVEGYKRGYTDCRKRMFTIDGIEYVDFELPSGTLWSKTLVTDPNGVVYISWEEAQRYSIPTPEQAEELLKCCKVGILRSTLEGVIYKGEEMVNAGRTGVKENGEIHNSGHLLWLKGQKEDPIEKKTLRCALHLYSGSGSIDAREWDNMELPILLVRNKMTRPATTSKQS